MKMYEFVHNWLFTYLYVIFDAEAIFSTIFFRKMSYLFLFTRSNVSTTFFSGSPVARLTMTLAASANRNAGSSSYTARTPPI